MGNVSSIIASMFPSITKTATSTSESIGGNNSSNYGNAVELSISQQNTGGSNTDTVSLYAYGQNSGNQLLGTSATSTSAERAFEQLINNLAGLGNPDDSSSAAGSLQTIFDQISDNLTAENTGTISISRGVEASGMQVTSASLTSGMGSTQTPQLLSQLPAAYVNAMRNAMPTIPLVNSVISSLQA